MDGKNAPLAIRMLATEILATFPEDFIQKEYQMESIPKSYYEVETTEKSTSNRVQISDWKHAYGIAEIYHAETDSESHYISIDKYLSKVRIFKQCYEIEIVFFLNLQII